MEFIKISKNKVPLIERPTSEQKAAEKRELSELFVDLSDESETELLDFVPKKKVRVLVLFEWFIKKTLISIF